MPIIYDVAAYFDRPVNGRRRATTRDDKQQSVDAESPEAAARKWYWRLSEVERRYTVRLVVFAPTLRPVLPQYDGDPVRFRRDGSRLIQLDGT
jgi:hypothetical protein